MNSGRKGYYVSTVDLNESMFAKYIRKQEKQDISLDKLSVKEYENTFINALGKKKTV